MPIEKVLILKSERKLYLIDELNEVIKEYDIKLGFAPKGNKLMEGDGKTPEGIYEIVHHNPNSKYYKSLKISYPSEADVKMAEALGVEPGSDIMIHGLENNSGISGYVKHLRRDWTAGCIAVTNDEMDEIYFYVSDGTEVEIRP